MRVLHVISSTERRGAQTFASDLVSALHRSGVDQRVVALRGTAGPTVGFDATVLQLVVPDGPLARFDRRVLRGVGEAVARFRPHVIQAHGGESLKYAIPATLRSRVPVVYRRIGATPEWASSAAQRAIYGALARRAAAVVAVSEATRQETLRVLRVPPERTVTIPNAVDARRISVRRSREAVRRELGIEQGSPVLVSVGALTWEKDPVGQVEIAAEVMRVVPGAVFLLAGDGLLRAEVEAAASSRGIEHALRLLGVREDVPDLLAASDVMLLASSTEGSPAVVIETGLLGLPVVAFAVGGVPELVEEGRTGVLVPPGDRRTLAAEVIALLRDPRRRAAMGRQAAERCRTRFEIAAVAPRYLDVYRRAARSRNGPERNGG